MFVKSYLSRYDVARGRSRFVGRAQRGDDKPRGRGLGRRNTGFEKSCGINKKQKKACLRTVAM